jgi:hypothetical protein
MAPPQAITFGAAGQANDDFRTNPFEKLPTEILIAIMRQISDLTSLGNIISVSRTTAGAFHGFGGEIIEQVMATSIPSKIQGIIRLIAYVRTPLMLCNGFDEFKAMYLGNLREAPTSFIAVLPSDVPSSVLRSLLTSARNIWDLSQECIRHYIARCSRLTPSFPIDREFRYQCVEGAPRPRRQTTKGREYKPRNAPFASWIEEQRVIRAFWLVQLFYDFRIAAKKSHLPWPADDLERLDEMDAADFYGCLSVEPEQVKTIMDYINEIQDKSEQPIAPNRLPAALRKFHGATTTAPLDLVTYQRSHLPKFFSLPSHLNYYAPGYRFVTSFLSSDPSSPLFYVSFEPFRRFGFAIWDDHRLCDLGMLNKPGQSRLARASHFYYIWRSILSDEELESIDRLADEIEQA